MYNRELYNKDASDSKPTLLCNFSHTDFSVGVFHKP